MNNNTGIKETFVEYNGRTYKPTNEKPKDGDLVFISGFGVWKFDSTTIAPYWTDESDCKKLVIVK